MPGSFTQSSTGTIDAQVGTYGGAASVGVLAATGSVQLGGALAVSVGSGAGLAQSTTLPLLTYSSENGSFASTSGLTLGQTQVFQLNVGAQQTSLIGVAAPSDLATTGVAGPTGSVAVGAPLDVSYTVEDEGPAAAQGSWTDSVYLSTNDGLSANAILLGRVTHTGSLAAGASYNGSLSTVMPPAVGSYQVVVVTDSGDVTADSDRSNNLAASASAFTATVPSLAVGGSVAGTLDPAQDLLYQVDVPAGTSVTLTLAAPAGLAALLARAGSLPSDSSFDAYALSSTTGQETVTVGGGQGGTVYVMIEPQAGITAGTSFTLQARVASFVASSISPTSANANSSFTVEITGSQFTPNTTVALEDGSVKVAATQVDVPGFGRSPGDFRQRERRELRGSRVRLRPHVDPARSVHRLGLQRRPECASTTRSS